MRRLFPVALTLCLVAVSGPAVIAQEDDVPNPIEVVVDALEAPEGKELATRLLRVGSGPLADPIVDFEHPTGQPPGLTPGHLDLTEAWGFELDTGAVEVFSSTSAGPLWARTGRLEVEPPNFPPFHTFTGSQTQDGSQYEGGALLFGFMLVDTPPVDAPGRCEYVIWVDDLARGATFVNDPAFPGDPAAGTNVAFGLGPGPEGEPGLHSTFALELQENGSFAQTPEMDVRGFVTPQYVGITVPRAQIGELGGVNFYTFCAEEGAGFEPENSGADQTGLVEISFDDLGAVAIEERDIPVETTTSTSRAPATTLPSTTEVESGVEAGPATTGASGEGSPWWFALIGGGLALVAAGWWLYKREPDPCEELAKAREVARTRCEQAQEEANEAEDVCEQTRVELEELETELRQICRAWPPACWSSDEGDWVEDRHGNRITSRDIHMRRVALGEVWADYKAGKLTAIEVESKWREMDTPGFREEIRHTDEEFKKLLEEIDADLEDARSRLGEACRRAHEARARADEACQAADYARRQHEDCMMNTVASTTTSEKVDEPGGDTALTRKHERSGEPAKTRVFVDFTMSIGASTEMGVAKGRELAIGLNDLATELEFESALADARTAGLHMGGDLTGYSPGKYVVAGSGVMKGGIEATAFAGGSTATPATTPLKGDVEGLESLARVGGVIAGKVGEWMAAAQTLSVGLTMLYQSITAVPYTLWEHRGEEGWTCLEEVWEIEISQVRATPGKDRALTVDSDVRRREFRRLIRGLGEQAAAAVKRDAEELVRWRVDREPGPCE